MIESRGCPKDASKKVQIKITLYSVTNAMDSLDIVTVF